MTLFEAVELDFEKNLLYSITFGTSSVTITKIRIPVFNIGLNEKLDDTTYTVLEEQTLTTESFTFLGDYTKYGEFMDGHDGYGYGFSNEPNICTALGVTLSQFFQEGNSENLTEKQKEVLGIWNDLSTNEQETVMSMLRGLRK